MAIYLSTILSTIVIEPPLVLVRSGSNPSPPSSRLLYMHAYSFTVSSEMVVMLYQKDSSCSARQAFFVMAIAKLLHGLSGSSFKT